jgi:hypothetical protein
MASTWKMLFDQAQTMKKANPKEQEALDRLCNRVNGSIIGIVVPMYVVGTTGGIAILTTVVNLITLILIIALLYGAVSFGMKLTKELGTDGPGAALGAVITRCIQQSVVGALTMIIGLVLNIMGMTQTSPMFTFAFWMMVHGPECLVAHALLFTKISQGKNKIKSAKTTTTTATSSSVAPES